MAKKNNKRHFIKEDKGSLSTMLRAFEDRIDEVEGFDEFDESLDEAREMHTWNVSYVGQGNKIRNHIVDAPDAYEANRKARRELGISYDDIDDVSLVENKDNMNEARQMHTWNVTYTGEGNKVKNHVVDAPDAYEANRKARRELGIDYTDIDDITMVENKKITEDYASNDISDVRERVEDYLGQLFSMRFEDWLVDMYNATRPDFMAKRVKGYDPSWANDEEDEDKLEKLYDTILTELVSYFGDELCYYEYAN